LSKPEAGTVEAGPATEPSRAGGYFGVPDPGEKPLGFARLMVILMSGHIGVRSRVNREEDFRRANGLHVFVAAIIYFLLVVGVLILVVTATTS
jgi:hypothetical protein